MEQQHHSPTSPPSRRALLAGAILITTAAAGPATRHEVTNAAAPDPPPTPTVAPDRPHRLVGPIADVLVRVLGGPQCTGTPVSGTRYVITAAHCVLDNRGHPAARNIVRDELAYTAIAVLVDTRYHDAPSARLDAAVLVMDKIIAGPAAVIGTALPAHGALTLAGYQALDTDGSLLRGTTPHNRPLPNGAHGTLIRIPSAPAGCTPDASSIETTTAVVKVPCGLIPGASGGGLFHTHEGVVTLIGIISNVAANLSVNGVVPLTSLHELLEHPTRYTHLLSQRDGPSRTVRTRITLS